MSAAGEGSTEPLLNSIESYIVLTEGAAELEQFKCDSPGDCRSMRSSPHRLLDSIESYIVLTEGAAELEQFKCKAPG